MISLLIDFVPSIRCYIRRLFLFVVEDNFFLQNFIRILYMENSHNSYTHKTDTSLRHTVPHTIVMRGKKIIYYIFLITLIHLHITLLRYKNFLDTSIA